MGPEKTLEKSSPVLAWLLNPHRELSHFTFLLPPNRTCEIRQRHQERHNLPTADREPRRGGRFPGFRTFGVLACLKMSYAAGRGSGGVADGLLPEYNSIVGAWVLEVSR